MSLTYPQLLTSLPEFAQQVSALVAELGLTELTQCDHVALRVNSQPVAEQLVAAFSAHGKILANNLINGRPIVIIQLHQPLAVGPYRVSYVELPYPKAPQHPQEGWEHIELVLPCGAITTQELAEALRQYAPAMDNILAGNSAIQVKHSSPTGEGERLANPTIAFKRGHVCVKVHPHGLADIVASEQASE